MYLLLNVITCIQAIVFGLLGRLLGRSLVIYYSNIMMLVSVVISYYLFYEVVLSGSVVTIELYKYAFSEVKVVIFGFLYDDLTVSMLVIIYTISCLVHIYAIGYMFYDPYLVRFLSFLGLFTFFMVFMVTSDNYIQLFFGWEGVGLSSYLLINFWYNRVQANKGALKAMVMNKIADIFFFLGILLLFIEMGTTDIIIVNSLIPLYTDNIITFIGSEIKVIDIISCLFFIGVVGKSAQLGLHTWLADAMEGPTPVSALLHAATMVTAGVFLLVRANVIFENASTWVLCIVGFFGIITAFLCSVVGFYQYDIKKIIAYSTCSQLGYMVTLCGLSCYNVAFYHLINHAFFKSLLFLGAGCIISVLFDEQDIRRYGNLAYKLPLVYACTLIGLLALVGFPFLTGFYSKDLVLECFYSRYLIDCYYIYSLGVITAFFTAAYSSKLLFFVFFFFSNYNVSEKKLENIEYMYSMLVPLVVLSLSSVFIGFIISDLFFGSGSNFLMNIVFINPNNYVYVDLLLVSPFISNLPLLVSFLAFFFGYRMSLYMCKNKNGSILGIYKYLINRYLYIYFGRGAFFNYIYNYIYIEFYKYTYRVHTKLLDKGFLEMIGPYGIYIYIKKWSLNEFLKKNLSIFYSTFICVFFFFLVCGVWLSYVYITISSYNIICVFLVILVYSKYEISNEKKNVW